MKKVTRIAENLQLWKDSAFLLRMIAQGHNKHIQNSEKRDICGPYFMQTNLNSWF